MIEDYSGTKAFKRHGWTASVVHAADVATDVLFGFFAEFERGDEDGTHAPKVTVNKARGTITIHTAAPRKLPPQDPDAETIDDPNRSRCAGSRSPRSSRWRRRSSPRPTS